MPLPNLKYSYLNEVLVVNLDNQGTQNAFDIGMAEKLSNLVLKEKPKSLVLSNSGTVFCSGGNLKYYKALKTKEEGILVNLRIKSILSELSDLEIPKACFVQGPCYGGGIELLSCFDKIYATPQSLFGLWQRRVGLSFGWGGGERLLKRLPEEKLQAWLLDASTLSAYDARKIGLIDDVVMSSRGIEKAVSWVSRSISLGEESFVKTKTVFQDEEKKFSELWLSDKHKKILNKF